MKLKLKYKLSSPEKALRHEDLQGAPLLILANKQVGICIASFVSLKFFKYMLLLIVFESVTNEQDLTNAVSAEELDRYLDLKKLDERVYMFEAVSGYDG